MPLVTDKNINMDPYLVKNLNMIKEKVTKKNWDWLFIVDGVERGGKSTWAQQAGYYLDPTLTIDSVTFKPKEFIDRVVDSKNFKSIIFDEAFRGLSARGSLTNINKTIVKMMTEMGQKNLFIFIVLPSFFDLDRYAALHRSRTLVHVYTDRDMNRGRYLFFNANKKKRLYLLGKKTYNYNVVESNFFARYYENSVIDPVAYAAKKNDALKELGRDDAKPTAFAKRLEQQRYNMISGLHIAYKWKTKDIAALIGLERDQITNILRGATELPNVIL